MSQQRTRSIRSSICKDSGPSSLSLDILFLSDLLSAFLLVWSQAAEVSIRSEFLCSSLYYLTKKLSTLNVRLSCSTHSVISCWWFNTLRLFIMRTREASTANLLSLSTSSNIFFFSSTGGGRGICSRSHWANMKENRAKRKSTA